MAKFIKKGVLQSGIVAFLIAALLGVMGGVPAAAQGPSVRIDPPTVVSKSAGDTFSVDVVVDSGTYNLKASRVEVGYDTDALEATDYAYQNLLGTDILEEPGSGITDGLVKYGVTRMAGNLAGPVSGGLITIDFKVKEGASVGSYALDVKNVTLKDETSANIPGVVESDGVVLVGVVPPSVGIDPPTVSKSAGDTFSVDVVVDSGAYNLKASRVEVGYDTDALEATDYAYQNLLGTDILEEPGSGITDGLVKYGVTRMAGNLAEPVSGSLITIDFKVKEGASVGSYALDVKNVTLKDETGANIPGVVPSDGTVNVVPPVKVLINEFVSNPGTLQEDEWIELYNPGAAPVNVSGWIIEDEVGNTSTITDGTSIVRDGYFVATDIPGLNNPGDLIMLKTVVETEIDRVAYGNGDVADNAPMPDVDESAGRYPNGTDTDADDDDFQIFAVPTPGAENGVVVRHALTVNISPEDAGEVALAPPQPDEGYVEDTEVTLTATANEDYEFDHWSDNVTGPGSANVGTITMDTDKTVTANFAVVPTYDLTVDISPEGAGEVALAPPQPDEGYVEDTEVTLTATANEGYEFDHWSDNVTGPGSANVGTITMDADKTVTAYFEETGPITGSLAKGERTGVLATIPSGATAVNITLETSEDKDLDLELYDGETRVIGWEGEIKSSPGGTYEGDAFDYSGFSGGEEYISAAVVSRDYTLKVFAFEAGSYEVSVSYEVPTPKPTLEATVSPPSERTSVGTPVDFTVAVENTGEADATNVNVNASSEYDIGFTTPGPQNIAVDESVDFVVAATPNEEGTDMPITLDVTYAEEVTAEATATLTATGILGHYRGLTGDADVVEIGDLAQAFTDWRDGKAPDGFTEPINSMQLLKLLKEWVQGF